MARHDVEPPAAGCIIAVAKEGFGTGVSESDALRSLTHNCGSMPKLVELYSSPTIPKGAVWVDEENWIAWQGEHENPVFYAVLQNGQRFIVGDQTDEPPAAPKGYLSKMVERRKAHRA